MLLIPVIGKESSTLYITFFFLYVCNTHSDKSQPPSFHRFLYIFSVWLGMLFSFLLLSYHFLFCYYSFCARNTVALEALSIAVKEKPNPVSSIKQIDIQHTCTPFFYDNFWWKTTSVDIVFVCTEVCSLSRSAIIIVLNRHTLLCIFTRMCSRTFCSWISIQNGGFFIVSAHWPGRFNYYGKRFLCMKYILSTYSRDHPAFCFWLKI